MDSCDTVERALTGHESFGASSPILDHRRDCLVAQLEVLAPELPSARELLESAPRHSARLFTEPTLRSAIGHAHNQLTATSPRGPHLLPLPACSAVLTEAARYIRDGGTDTPLQDGSLIALRADDDDCRLWSDEHTDDAYGRAFRELVAARYGASPGSFDTDSIEMLRAGARLLDELLPALGRSALRHAHVIACVPDTRRFGSSSRPDLGGVAFLRRSPPSAWWVAEGLLHESTHLKLYDLLGGDTFTQSDGTQRSVLVPWNPSQLCGANRWHAWRVLAAMHVYVHLALLNTVAERRGAELTSRYGPVYGMTGSHRAAARARYLGRQLRAQTECWDLLGPVGRGLTDWLLSLMDVLEPAPAPEGATLHLYLDLYRRETDRVERILADPARHTDTERVLSAIARQDVSRARAILCELGADAHVAELDAAAGYPGIRRIIERCLLAASLDGYRMSESARHDAMVAELVSASSDALHALASPRGP